MRKLLDGGYITQRHTKVNPMKTIKVLNVNWDAVKKDGIWTD